MVSELFLGLAMEPDQTMQKARAAVALQPAELALGKAGVTDHL